VKICDFGISGYLVDSIAKTIDAGCKPYMAVRNCEILFSGNFISVFSMYSHYFFCSQKG